MSRSLDGDNDVLTTTSVVVDSTTTETTPFTIVMWIKRARTSFGTEETLWINGGAAQNNHLHCCVINSDNTLTLRARTSANSAVNTAGTITDTSAWHMIACKVVSTTALSISIDGAAWTDATGLTARDPTIATDTFRVGGSLAATPINEFNGLVSWVGAWQLALTSPNLTALWNSGAGLNLSNIGGPTCVWDLNDNQSPELNNVSPGTSDLTVAGATFSSDDPFVIGATGSLLTRRRGDLSGGMASYTGGMR